MAIRRVRGELWMLVDGAVGPQPQCFSANQSHTKGLREVRSPSECVIDVMLRRKSGCLLLIVVDGVTCWKFAGSGRVPQGES